jgi:helicase
MAFRGLFIGIDRYASPGVNWLSCVGRDARALHALFTDSFGGETTLLLDDQATVAEIGRRFDTLSACDPEDVVVVAIFRPRHELSRTGSRTTLIRAT